MKSTEIKMKPHQIAKAILTWNHWPGFSGESCGQCHATVNTFGGGPGWFCPKCDSYNNQNFSGKCTPWPIPDYGPTKRTIIKGGKLSEKYTVRQRKFANTEKIAINIKPYPYRYYEAIFRFARIVKLCYSFCGLRWYTVLLENGTEKMVFEPNIKNR